MPKCGKPIVQLRVSEAQGQETQGDKSNDLKVSYIWMISMFLINSKCLDQLLVMITQEKKIWCEQEDSILRKLFEEGQQSWSIIAKKLANQHGFPRKSAKQCRERYENHISAEGERIDWTLQEQQRLVQLHNEIGNKWSLIAEKIPGKSDNSVKNHFYSKLRKILRKLNSVIQSHLRREYRQINIGTLYKIIEATQQRFKEEPACGHSVSMACQEVQNRMLNVSMLHEEEFDSEERLQIYSDIVRDISVASKLYKRKSKKTRNSAIQAPNTRRKKKRQANIIVKNPSDQGYNSDRSSIFQQEKDEKDDEEDFGKDEARADVIVEEQQEGIRGMLQDAGILKFDEQSINRSVIRFSSKSSFKSYSENNNIQSDNQFFDDSEIENGFSRRKGSFYRFKSGLFDDPAARSDQEGGDFTLN